VFKEFKEPLVLVQQVFKEPLVFKELLDLMEQPDQEPLEPAEQLDCVEPQVHKEPLA
jgi:hypothetical protein